MSFQRVADILPTVLQQISCLSASCTNFHAATSGETSLNTWRNELFAPKSAQSVNAALFSSFWEDHQTPSTSPARPLKGKRRAWQRKQTYQRRRCSERLRPWQVEGLFEADRFARAMGFPLNTFVSVNWLLTEGGRQQPQRQFQKGMKRFCEWARRRGLPTYWIYVHENPNNLMPNTHMLFHVPKRLLPEFIRDCARWFMAIGSGVHVRTRRGPSDTCLAYMVKGTDFITARRHGARAKRQGNISFKRGGWSESLGHSARAKQQTSAVHVLSN